jgi:F-type H+-transporting ATPase subunit beta
MAERDGVNTGRIVEIKGVVIDAVFPERLPEILTALEIEVPTGTLVAEVQQHLGDDRVRAVAMDSTDGLARGLEVVDTRAPQPPGHEVTRFGPADMVTSGSLR